jgi:hypothetical protein
MKNTNMSEKELLVARMEKLKGEIIHIKKEGEDIIKFKKKGVKFDKPPGENDEIRNKVFAELLQRENDILKIKSLIKDDADKQDVDLERIKSIIEEKGLKQQVKNLLKKNAVRSKSFSDCITDCTDCVTDCTDCVHCDYDCVSGCTTCVSCTSDEVTGNLPIP